MTFTKSIREMRKDIYVDDIKIDTVNKTTLLGLVSNKTLNWSAHIKYICSKISKNIDIMKKVKNKLETKIIAKSILYAYLTVYYLL